MPTVLQVEDVPPLPSGCQHNFALREAVIDAVNTFWTTNPTVPERSITRLAALKQRIADAAGVDVSQVSNRMAARAVLAHLDERFGGTDA